MAATSATADRALSATPPGPLMCQTFPAGAGVPPTISHGSSPPGLGNTFAVLRRRQTGPERSRVHSYVVGSLASDGARIAFINELRVVAQPAADDTIALVPIYPRVPRLSASCLKRLPAKVVARLRRVARRTAEVPGACLVAGNGGIDACQSLSEAKRGLLMSLAEDNPPSPSTGASIGRVIIVGLAPDGVANVKARFPNGQTLITAVKDNVFTFNQSLRHPSLGSIALPFPRMLILLSPSGKTITTSKLPPVRERIGGQ